MNQIVRLPGQETADAIISDYAQALNGSIAWVKMGIRLAWVKSQCPHGEFMPWVNKHLAAQGFSASPSKTPQRNSQIERKPDGEISHTVRNLSHGHLFRAKKVAEYLLTAHEIDPLDGLKVIEDGNHPIWNDVLGRSTRQLTLEAREAKVLDADEIAAEAKAKEWCEDIWEKKPEWRDKYEPKVLAGEYGYVRAKTAMTGNKNQGEERPATKYAKLLEDNFCGAARHFCQFEKLTEQEQEKIVEAAISMAEKCPPRIAAILREVLPRVEGGAE